MVMHPIVAQMTPSQEQRKAILARGRDVVVTAGAGTGKTRTLVARYLSLLAEGHALRSIVAITFTRKAAREMRNRVREEIRRYLERPDLDAGERQWWLDLYSGLDAARIGTIHSLCSEILRIHPAEAGIDPRFEVLEEGLASILLTRAVDEALTWAADQGGVVALFALLGEWRLRSTAESLIRQRLALEECFRDLPEPVWPHWESRLLPPIRAFLDDTSVQASFEELLSLRDDGTLDRAEAAGDRLAAPLRQLLTLWDEISAARAQGDWAAVSVRLAPLRSAMKPSSGRAATWKPAEPKASLAELVAAYDARLQPWGGKGINLAHDRQLAEAMPALRALLFHAAKTYQRLKEARQALDFDDLEHGALALLEQNAAVRAHWQRQIQSVLVDEFQDTNGRQRDFVARLCHSPGKLFIVGDAKQSIYRFRGADVVVFRQERERIERQGGAAYPLQTSYRAHRELIQGLNDLLRPVLGEEADPDRPWAEPFAPLRHHRRQPGPGFTAPHVELHLTVGSKGGGALDRAANALAARIVDLVDGDLRVFDSGDPRPLSYGDFAILCRASTSFGAYEDALERAGLPFLTVAGRGFYGRPEIRDLLNILQALSDPTDDLALTGLLRSPALALSDAALLHLCQARDQAGGGTSLWDVVRAGTSVLSANQGQYVQRAARLVDQLHGKVGRTSVADLLKDFLDLTGYRAALIQAGQSRAARNISKLLADAHGSGMVGVGEFLEYVAVLRGSGSREGEARATTEGAVQIMTVHAAKGLEFPVVILGDVTRGGGRGGSLLVDPDLGPLLSIRDDEGQPAAIYRLGKVRSDDQEGAEADRLLYVAATRAREKLILSGCIDLRKDGTPAKLGGWLGKLAGEHGLPLAGMPIAHDAEGAEVIHLDLHVGSTPVVCAVYEPGYAWDPSPRQVEVEPELAAPVPPPLLAPVSTGKEEVDGRTSAQERIPPQRVWRVVPAVKRSRAPAWVIGSLVHEALAAWRFPTGADADFSRWCQARARGYGLTDHQQLADAVSRTRRLLLRFHAHPLYREMDEAGRRLHEVPYSLIVDRRVESGVIDVLYCRDGAWTIVEFKTDDVRDQADLERLLATQGYLAQAQRYISAVERLLGQPPRFTLCLLNYAGSVHRVPLVAESGE